jgi:Domain of unknown function (DUF4399)
MSCRGRPAHRLPFKSSCGYAGTGHFHVNVDSQEFPAGQVIPFDDQHYHFGKGQMQADIQLPSGPHKVELQFANAVHESYGSEYRSSVNLIVK